MIKDRQKETGDEIRIIGNLPKVFRVGDLNLETKSNSSLNLALLGSAFAPSSSIMFPSIGAIIKEVVCKFFLFFPPFFLVFFPFFLSSFLYSIAVSNTTSRKG